MVSPSYTTTGCDYLNYNQTCTTITYPCDCNLIATSVRWLKSVEPSAFEEPLKRFLNQAHDRSFWMQRYFHGFQNQLPDLSFTQAIFRYQRYDRSTLAKQKRRLRNQKLRSKT